jgi:hypothetical protein
MSLSVSFENHSDYFSVRLSGSIDPNEVTRVLDEVKNEADRNGQRRVFVDMRGVALPTGDMFRYIAGEHIAKVMSPPYKLVLLGDTRTINRFAENVAVNRGADLKVFDDDKAALQWLLPAADELE